MNNIEKLTMNSEENIDKSYNQELEIVKSMQWAEEAKEELKAQKEYEAEDVETAFYNYDEEIDYVEVDEDEVKIYDEAENKVEVEMLFDEDDILNALNDASALEVGEFKMTLSNDKVIVLPLQVLDANQIEAIRKKSIIKNEKYWKNNKAKRKDPNFTPDLDTNKYMALLVYESTKPNKETGLKVWDNRNAWKKKEEQLMKQGVNQSIKSGISYMLASVKPGTISSAATEILEYSGYNDVVEEIKK